MMDPRSKGRLGDKDIQIINENQEGIKKILENIQRSEEPLRKLMEPLMEQSKQFQEMAKRISSEIPAIPPNFCNVDIPLTHTVC